MKHLFPAVTAAAFLIFVVQARENATIRRDLKKAVAQIAPRAANAAGPKSDPSSEGLESRLSRLAASAGIHRLLSVGSAGQTSVEKTVSVEWEGTQASSLRWLAALQSPQGLGPCSQLSISASARSPGLLHARGTFLENRRGGQTEPPPSLRPTRDIFAPLWRDAAPPSALPSAREQKKAEEARRIEQQKMEQDRVAQEEIRRTEERKRGFETQWAVTGIVNNGKEPLAFMNSRTAGGQTLMVRNGDLIEEARVTGIDAARGEVRLDYLGKFQVTLKMP